MLGQEGRASKEENRSNVSIRYPPTIQIASTVLTLPLRVKASATYVDYILQSLRHRDVFAFNFSSPSSV